MIEEIGFYFFSVCCVVLFAISVFSKNVIYAMSALLGAMVFVSGFFFLLDAEFLGVIQIIVYVGAVLVLYAFAIMLLNSAKSLKESKVNIAIYALAAIAMILLVFITSSHFISGEISLTNSQISPALPNTNSLGMVIFTKYIAIFEICALMLLVAMICATVLVTSHKKDANEP